MSLSEVYLPAKQYRIVLFILDGVESLEKVAEKMGLKPDDLMRDVTELNNKGLIYVEKIVEKKYRLSRIGKLYLEKDVPERLILLNYDKCPEKMLSNLVRCIAELTGMNPGEISIGVQYLIKSGCAKIMNDTLIMINQEACREIDSKAGVIKDLLKKIESNEDIREDEALELKKRKMIEVVERKVTKLRPSSFLLDLFSKGLVKEKELITIVRPSMALNLQKYAIKEFDLSVPLPRVPVVRKHPFMEFIDDLRDIMVALGFEEVKGPHVEAEFWNFDVLYQAQDHPAREIHDTFYIKDEARANIPPELLERARRIHESGWKYKWSPERAVRLVLRSQTTAVSARTIFERGEGEYRVFTIDRVFRPENLDAKHSMEFYQLDGIIVGKNVNFKHLLYFFKELSAALGIKEVWFKPGYFPFTEPSVEGYIRHPSLGWVEVFPGGVFRPEVMEILGAPNTRAVAWGIGVDRLAMQVLGIDDIRLLFSRDLDMLERLTYAGLPYKFTKTDGKSVKVYEYPE